MDPSLSTRTRVRFGDFEADLRAGELQKNGLEIKLQPLPFEILALLLRHPGELVTPEELRRELWNGDTFVDFDHSVRTAINKIRTALADSTSNPQYVETLPRRGYRFIAPVDFVERVPARKTSKLRGCLLQHIRTVLAAAALLIIVGAVLGSCPQSAEETSPSSLETIPLTSFPGSECDPALSPDGNLMLAYGMGNRAKTLTSTSNHSREEQILD